MSPRRNDRFVQSTVRNRRNHQRRRQQRRLEHANGEISLMEEISANLKDSLKSGSKEFGLLGLEVGKGVVREAASFGADFLITLTTLGLAEPYSISSGRSRRCRRRR